jgi:hypothetical protein
MESVPLLDCAGRRRSPATLSSFHVGRPPRNRGRRYPPDPPTRRPADPPTRRPVDPSTRRPVEEIIAVMRAAGETPLEPGCAA